MKGKLTLLVGGAVGYVLGTKAGRERYEQIKTQAEGLWNHPKVQETANQAQSLVKDKAPLVKDKVGEKVGDKVGSSPEPTVPPVDEVEVIEIIEPAPYPTSATTGL